MNITVSFKNIDSSDALRTFIFEKCETLEKYFNGNTTLGWTLTSNKQGKIVHCHLVGNHMDYFGEGITDDYRASVDVVIDKIEKQLRKHKEIITNHLHDRSVTHRSTA